MLAIYYFVLFFAGLFIGPLLLLRRKARAGLKQKLGIIPANFADFGERRPDAIWIHAVSVGEFNAVLPLLTELHVKYPEQAFVISTTTKTGQELARNKAGSFAEIIYFPFDVPWATCAWLERIAPKAVFIVETEIWPGFYSECAKRNIPIVIVNGRISPRSYNRYKKLRNLFGTALKSASLILCQSQQEAERYFDLTRGGTEIVVTGNLKFDGLKAVSEVEQAALKERIGILPDDVVIVAGSTHEGEETALINAQKKLVAAGIQSKLILAPRHPERFERVSDLIAQNGFRTKRFTKNDSFESTNDVYLLDTIGQLMRYYSGASIAFVGGTIAPIGGHNLVEPCVYSVPVVCGPHVFKTRDVAQSMAQQNAIKQASGEEQLVQFIVELARNAELRAEVGRNGAQWLNASHGAVQRALTALEDFPGLLDKVSTDVTVLEATR